VGTVHARVKGKEVTIEDERTTDEVVQDLGYPPSSHLINQDNKQLKGKLKGQIKDGDDLTVVPAYSEWRE